MTDIFSNSQAEALLVATVISDGRAWPDVQFLQPGQFESPVYGEIWKQISLHRGRIGPESLAQELANTNLAGQTLLQHIGGDIAPFLSIARAGDQARELAGVVVECATNRQLAAVLGREHPVFRQSRSSLERIDHLQRQLSQITVGGAVADRFADGIDQWWQEVEYYRRNPGMLHGLRLGLRDLDEGVIHGLEPGDLLVVASNPNEGKSIMVGEFSRWLATNDQDDGKRRKVAFFGTEMSAAQMANRFCCAWARISADDIRDNKIGPKEWERLGEAKEWVIGQMKPNFIYRGPGEITIRDIVYQSTCLVRQEGVQVIVIDYLQRISTGRRDKRTEEIGDITSRLKALASDLEVPIILVSQVTREVGKERGGRPRLWDMAESAAVERDADYVLTLWRPARHMPERQAIRDHWLDVAVVELVKGRFRKTSSCYLRFDGPCARFDSLDVDTVKRLRQWEADGELVFNDPPPKKKEKK